MLKHFSDLSTDVMSGRVVSSLADVMAETADVVSSPAELMTADVVSSLADVMTADVVSSLAELMTADVVSSLADVMTADVIPSPAEARMLAVVVRFSGHVNGNLAGK